MRKLLHAASNHFPDYSNGLRPRQKIRLDSTYFTSERPTRVPTTSLSSTQSTSSTTPTPLPRIMTSPIGSSSFTRVPFTGSCHCKTIRYIVYVRIIDPSKLPTDTKVDAFSYSSITGGQSQYRCNCTVNTFSQILIPPHFPA